MVNYGGIPEEFSTYEKASIVVVPVPYDGTSTWVKGADHGPEALLEASANMELFDIETASEVYTKGIATIDPVTEASSPEAMCAAVENTMDKVFDDGKFPVLIGGEHSVSIGAIRSAAKHFPDLTILQFDAHTDLRESYEESECNHACVMHRALEVAHIVQVGIRSCCIEEQPFIQRDNIFYAHEILDGGSSWMYKAEKRLKDNVYITIDLDVFDPSILPSTGTPEPNGLAYRTVLNFIRLVNVTHNIVGFDVVELCPNETEKASDFLASKLIYQILSQRFSEE